MIPVLILAAGASSRMRGRDKLMEDVHGQPQMVLLGTRSFLMRVCGQNLKTCREIPVLRKF